MSQPEKECWEATKWILRYLKGTLDVGLIYMQRTLTQGLQSGYVFQLGGCAISWKSNLQSIVALSTAEAEYIA